MYVVLEGRSEEVSDGASEGEVRRFGVKGRIWDLFVVT